MLSDRHYMRDDYEPRRGSSRFAHPASTVLMISLVVAFALEQIDLGYFQGRYLSELMLSSEGLCTGHVWQLLTFQFLHVGLTHLAFNLLGVFFFGRFVEQRLGTAHFLKLYFLSGVAGGLLQATLGWFFPLHLGIPTMGASAGVCGLLAAFSLIEPEGFILVFFVLPVKAKYLLYGETVIALFFTIVPTDPGVAHAAHLGGIMFGAYYVRYGMRLLQELADWNPLRRRSRREKLIRAATVPALRIRPSTKKSDADELPSGEFISQEVDPILDKISAHGIQSLTDRERQILQAARAKMSGR